MSLRTRRVPATLLPLAILPLVLLGLVHADDPLEGQAAATQMPWQRSLADAEELSRRTGKPLLICVNLDGEPASERFANSKYHNSAFIELAAGFIPVLISPSRHCPQDYDDEGQRIEDPRFGLVTCGEHMANDVPAYKRYMNGRRVAPRHIGVSPAGKILFDRFLDRDLSRVDAALTHYGSAQGTSGWWSLIDSRDHAQRELLLEQYRSSDRSVRLDMLTIAGRVRSEPFEVLRLGLREADTELRTTAARSLAAIATLPARELLAECLRAEWPSDLRDELIRAMEKLGLGDAESLRAARVQKGLSSVDARLRPSIWQGAYGQYPLPQNDVLPTDINGAILLLENYMADGFLPQHAAICELQLARLQLSCARAQISNGRDPSFQLVDARDSVERASVAGALLAPCAALRAQIGYLQGELSGVADDALAAFPVLIADPSSIETVHVLAALARVRTQDLYGSDMNANDWPLEWLGQAQGAFDLLADHPHGSAALAINHIDLLSWLGAQGAAGRAVRRALERWPASPELHALLRSNIISTRGVRALESEYNERAQLVQVNGDQATHAWYAGYASLVFAEERVTASAELAADEAYDRAVDAFDRSILGNPEYADSADHYVSLALAGRARLASNAGAHEQATRHILLALTRRPASADASDGLHRTPLSILRHVRSGLDKAGEEGLRLKDALEGRLATAVPDLWEMLKN